MSKGKNNISALAVNVSVKDIEPMKAVVIAAFEMCCLHRSGESIPDHKFFELEVALNNMGVNEEAYINPCLVAGDEHGKE